MQYRSSCACVLNIRSAFFFLCAKNHCKKSKHSYDIVHGIDWKFDVLNFHSTCIVGFSTNADCPQLLFELQLNSVLQPLGSIEPMELV